jgi:fucose 4-O-acetylase-like acetyltransferase
VRIIILQQKIEWIDSLKTLGILAVILGHIASPFGQFIFSWHMPLFFVIAGFFIKFNTPFKEFFLKNFLRLMIPYFIFAFIGLGADNIKRFLLHREELNNFVEIQNIFFGMDITSLLNHYGFVLWFLPALFFGKMILYAINKVTLNLLFQGLIVFALFLISFIIEIPFGLDNAANSILWIFLGYLFFNFYINSKILSLYFTISALILVSFYILFGIPSLDLAMKSYENIFINIFWAVSVIYIFVFLIRKIKYPNTFSKVFSIWGGNTMLLFIVHPYTNNIGHIIVEALHFGDWYLKLLISLILLQIIIFIKLKFNNQWIFKYV